MMALRILRMPHDAIVADHSTWRCQETRHAPWRQDPSPHRGLGKRPRRSPRGGNCLPRLGGHRSDGVAPEVCGKIAPESCVLSVRVRSASVLTVLGRQPRGFCDAVHVASARRTDPRYNPKSGRPRPRSVCHAGPPSRYRRSHRDVRRSLRAVTRWWTTGRLRFGSCSGEYCVVKIL